MKKSCALDAFDHDCGRKARGCDRARSENEQRLYHDGPPNAIDHVSYGLSTNPAREREDRRSAPVMYEQVDATSGKSGFVNAVRLSM